MIVGLCPLNIFIPGACCVQVYIAAIAFELNWIVSPAHTSAIASIVGIVGLLSTTSTIVVGALSHPSIVTITSYIPASETDTLAMDGFCSLKLFGPVHW